MIERMVKICFQQRKIIWVFFALLVGLGTYSWFQLPLEAYPDIAPVTSQVITQVSGLAAAEVEQQITIPLERVLLSTPAMEMMRSRSTFGLSLITVVFKEGTENFFSRERLADKINSINLPYGAHPGLDPMTSPIGEIYRYTLSSSTYSLAELSELQFWKVIPRIRQVSGVTEVTNFGGLTSQLNLSLDPLALSQYHLSLGQIEQAIQSNNANAGGAISLHSDQSIVIRGLGLIRSLKDLGNIEVSQSKGNPIFVKDLGELSIGHKLRRGIAGEDHQADVVVGIVQMLKGENPSKVVAGIHEAVADLNQYILPRGVTLKPYIDRSDLVSSTVGTVSETLVFGMILVTLILYVFLRSIRAALIVALTIPLALMMAFVCMNNFNIPANLLSLGAIDFGILVDGAIVVVENILRKREANPQEEYSEDEAIKSALQVTQPIFFGILVIITAYSVLFVFQNIEYKLFAPMAFAVSFALLGSLAVALGLTPGLAYVAYRRPIHLVKNKWMEWLKPRYASLLSFLIERSKWVLGVYLVTLMLVIALMMSVGRDFLPYLDEGSLWLQITLPADISLDKSSEIASQLREASMEFPEVKHVVTQIGRNDDGTDPWMPSHIEAAVTLNPYNTWPRGVDKQGLIGILAKRYERIAGVHVAFTQPIIDGVLDKVAGAHSDLVIKIFGTDMVGMRDLGKHLVKLLQSIKGAQDVIIDQPPPVTELRIEVDRQAIARLGIPIADVMDLIQTGIGGTPVSTMYIRERNYDITLRFPEAVRNDPAAIGRLLLTTSTGAQVALSGLAKIYYADGQSMIIHEMTHRQLIVRLNLRGRDVYSFSQEAKTKIAKELPYSHNDYRMLWGGQLENQQRAQARLMLILPMLLGLMFLLLFSQFNTLRHPMLILSGVPLAMLGGLLALEMRGMSLNVSSAVGFIALFGVVVLNAIIMIANLNRWQKEKNLPLKEAIIAAAQERLRPVLMTASVAAMGMIPAAINHGLGSDVQRPLATVIVGGLISATALTLLLLPALYWIIESRRLARQSSPGIAYE